MKPRHEFKTTLEHENYMKCYYSGLALSGLLLSNDFEDESLLVKKAIDIASLMTAHLFPQTQAITPTKEKPPLIEKKQEEHNQRNELIQLTDSAIALYNQKAYKSALTQFEKAIALDPSNKKINNSIDLCKKWIKSIDDLNKEEKELTTNFPPLD